MGDFKLSEIIKSISALVFLISQLITFIKIKSDSYFLWKYILYITIFVTSLFFIYYLIRVFFLKKRGVRGEYIKLRLFLKKFNPFLINHYTKYVHSFHHTITHAIEQVNTHKYKLDDARTRKLTAELMRECYEMLTQTIGVEFSLNIKLFEKLNNTPENIVSIDEVVLKTYERFPSKRERENIANEKYSARSSSELFKINKCTKEDLDTLVSTAIASSKGGDYKCNYGYDFALGPTKHYYLSNNLEKDIKNKKFHCTSDSIEKYYNSLGVFLISPPFNSGDYIDINNVLGIIIIDCLERNVFYDRYIACIMGYYAHRFYNFFSIFKNS